MRPQRSGSSGTGVGRRRQPGVLAHGSFTTSQTPAARCLHRDVRPRLQGLGGPLHSPDCALGPPTRPASGTGGLPSCLLPSADLSVGEQRGRRAMKVSRVFSVSPTFHKLLVVEETGTQLVYHLPARSVLAAAPFSHLSRSPGSSLPPQFFLASHPPHWSPVPSPAPSATSPHLMACSWLSGGRHLEKMPKIRSSTFQPEEAEGGRRLRPRGKGGAGAVRGVCGGAGRRRGGAGRGRGGAGRGPTGPTADVDFLHRLVLRIQFHLDCGMEVHVFALQAVKAAGPRQPLVV